MKKILCSLMAILLLASASPQAVAESSSAPQNSTLADVSTMASEPIESTADSTPESVISLPDSVSTTSPIDSSTPEPPVSQPLEEPEASSATSTPFDFEGMAGLLGEATDEEIELPEPTAELIVFGGVVLQGDSYYAPENLPQAAAVMEDEKQITEQYSIVVEDFGGYDVNIPGNYVVSFTATHVTDEHQPILHGQGEFTVMTLDEHAGLGNEEMPEATIAAASEYTDTFKLLPANTPFGDVAGFAVIASPSSFHGYRNAQAIPTSGDIMLFSGTASNYFYRYHVQTDQGYAVPLYCVEPNVQDKDDTGKWRGNAGWIYSSVSNNNGTTGIFHTHKAGWGTATTAQRRAASGIGYFSRPEANLYGTNDLKTSETYYVAAQVLIWECLTGTIETDPSKTNFMEPISIAYLNRNTGKTVTGNYHNYANSPYKAAIVGNDYPEYGYPTLAAYNNIRNRLKNLYNFPTFMKSTAALAKNAANRIQLPTPGSGSRKINASATLLKSIDWTAVQKDGRVTIDTTKIASGYITVTAKVVIPNTAPAVFEYAKAGTRTSTQKSFFISPYGNAVVFNGEPMGQTKMTNQTMSSVSAFMAFYSEPVANPSSGQIVIQKIDAATGNKITAPATFQIIAAENIYVGGSIKWANGTVVETLTTGTATQDRDMNGNLTGSLVALSDSGIAIAPGIAISSHLPLGNYRIKEISAPAGYYGSWSGEISLIADGQVELVKPTNQKQSIEVIKVDAANTGRTLAGAEFDLYEWQTSAWVKVDHLVCSSAGRGTSDKVQIGRYKLVETLAPVGYTCNWEQEFTVSTTNTLITLTATDNKQRIELVKVDAADQSIKLAGAEFDLLEQQPGGTWLTVDHIVVDAAGKGGSDKVKNGRYKLVETLAPVGYICDWEQEFTVTANTALYTFTATDKKQRIELLKVDAADPSKTLAGAEFDLLEQQPDMSWLPIDRIVIGADGKGQSNKIKNGQYKLLEVIPPEGYACDWAKEFTVTADTEVYSFTATNTKQYIEVAKVDIDKPELFLPNAEFDLYELQTDGEWQHVEHLVTGQNGRARSDKVRNGYYKVVEAAAPEGYTKGWQQEFDVSDKAVFIPMTSKNYKQNLKLRKVDASDPTIPLAGAEFDLLEQQNGEWKLVEHFVTDSNGWIQTENIHTGRYKLVETAAPTSYVCNWQQEFDVTDSQNLYEFTATNKRISGKVEIVKVDADTLKPLEGVEFEVVDAAGKVVATLITDDKGRAECTLPHGKYTVRETKTAVGYILDPDTTIRIEIKEDGVVVPLSATNSRRLGRVVFRIPSQTTPGIKRFPKTGVSSEVESITTETTITADKADNPHYDAPPETKRDGIVYKLQGVTYRLVDSPIVEKVKFDSLQEKSVPETHVVDRKGKSYTLNLLEVNYTAAPASERVETSLDFGYTLTQPEAPTTDPVQVTGSIKAELPFSHMELAEDYSWHDIDIEATYYGTEDTYGFVLGDAILPNTGTEPPWQGYESNILAALGLSEQQFRIVGASWIDAAFVPEGDELARRATIQAQQLAARWVAHYSGMVDTGEVYSADAVYSNDVDGKDGYTFLALATYTAPVSAAPHAAAPAAPAKPFNYVALAATVLGAVLLIALVIWILFILKRRREREESEESTAH